MRRAWMLALPVLVAGLIARPHLAPQRDEEPYDPLVDLQGRSDTQAAQFVAIARESMESDAEALAALKVAGTDQQRRLALRARHEAYRRGAGRLLALADGAPDDPTLADALIWLVEKIPETREGAEAADLLLRHHLRSARLAGASERIARSGSDLAVRVLRAVAREHPDAAIRFDAEHQLARILKARAERLDWRDLDEARTLAKEAEAGFERALALGDWLTGPNATADRIRSELDELRRLGPGAPAPEIEGEDLDGRPMRLGDYRGRVVAVTFWGDWCSLCRHLYPHERSLVERMRGRPFALLGVNSDVPEVARTVSQNGEVTWRSWKDGGQVHGGAIARSWNVRALPVTFLIDDRGVIRHKVGTRDDDHDTAFFLDADGELRNRWESRGDEVREVAEALVREVEQRREPGLRAEGSPIRRDGIPQTRALLGGGGGR